MLNYIEYLNMPTKVAFVIATIFFVMQVIGEVLEFRGKVVPEWIKIRKYFKRKKKDNEEIQEQPNEKVEEVHTQQVQVDKEYTNPTPHIVDFDLGEQPPKEEKSSQDEVPFPFEEVQVAETTSIEQAPAEESNEREPEPEKEPDFTITDEHTEEDEAPCGTVPQAV